MKWFLVGVHDNMSTDEIQDLMPFADVEEYDERGGW